MASVKKYRQYAADCVRQAQSEETPDDKTIMLNVALAWLRLAQQAEELRQEAVQQDDAPPTVPSDTADHTRQPEPTLLAT